MYRRTTGHYYLEMSGEGKSGTKKSYSWVGSLEASKWNKPGSLKELVLSSLTHTHTQHRHFYYASNFHSAWLSQGAVQFLRTWMIVERKGSLQYQDINLPNPTMSQHTPNTLLQNLSWADKTWHNLLDDFSKGFTFTMTWLRRIWSINHGCVGGLFRSLSHTELPSTWKIRRFFSDGEHSNLFTVGATEVDVD